MIEQLLGSNTRYKLLQLFMNHPSSYYYVRQLTRVLDTQINSIRRELQNLEQIGIITSAKEIPDMLESVKKEFAKNDIHASQKKFFKLNTDFFLYHELRALFAKEQMAGEKDLIKALKKLGNVHYMALTGMFVGLSDHISTDILIVGKVNPAKLSQTISDFEKTFRKEIRYTVFTYKEYKYRYSVNDQFLHSVLNNKKLIVIDELEDGDSYSSKYEALEDYSPDESDAPVFVS